MMLKRFILKLSGLDYNRKETEVEIAAQQDPDGGVVLMVGLYCFPLTDFVDVLDQLRAEVDL